MLAMKEFFVYLIASFLVIMIFGLITKFYLYL